MFHEQFTDVVFTCQYPVRLWGRDYKAGEDLTVGLVRNWDDEEEGMGEGGPWGWGGFPSRLIANLAGDIGGHTHVCASCGHEIAYDVFDCESDTDHDYGLCDACTLTGVRL